MPQLNPDSKSNRLNNPTLALLTFFGIFFFGACQSDKKDTSPKNLDLKAPIVVAADLPEVYIPLLRAKRVGLIANQTSRAKGGHLIDLLMLEEINVLRIFAPEHGFRGKEDAGAKVVDGFDEKTGIPLISIYGENRKPKPENVADLDILVFDIQDVGARFYTYISTLELAMEAAAEADIEFMVLDRPNPMGHLVAGPVLNDSFQSFVGKQAIPVVHGLTVGEYAQYLQGEKLFNKAEDLRLSVVKCKNYLHSMDYVLPIPPSPNLPNQKSIYAYPSTCFFEGTVLSEGRGTNSPFLIFGHPSIPDADGRSRFKPESMAGAMDPKLKDEECVGWDHSIDSIASLKARGWTIEYLKKAYDAFPNKEAFFLENGWFDKLAGTSRLRNWLIKGRDMKFIAQKLEEEIQEFKSIRKKYLLYPDFE